MVRSCVAWCDRKNQQKVGVDKGPCKEGMYFIYVQRPERIFIIIRSTPSRLDTIESDDLSGARKQVLNLL